MTSPSKDLNFTWVASSSSALERVNLNLPAEARGKLRSLAKAAGQPEAVYARDLLVAALEDAETAELRRRIQAAMTPERRARERKIATALERLRG